jgi:HD-like signal output (HDOD) protein
MGNWLGRLLGKSSARAPATMPVASLPGTAVRAAEAGSAAWRPALDVDVVFCRWLLGQPGAIAEHADASELAYLERLSAQADSSGTAALVPRVPAVVPQLLHTLRDPARPMSVLARQLAQDPVLVAGVLKRARSPFYGLQRPVTSLEQALMVIGQDGLRHMLASLAFKPIIDLRSGDYTRRGAPRVWDQSERCGLACQVLAPATGASAFEAFLAALLHSVGLVVILRLLDDGAPAGLTASTRACTLIMERARNIACLIGRQWTFPEPVIGAITERDPAQGAPGHTALGDLFRMCADVSSLRVLADAGVLAPDDERLGLAAHPAVQRCFQLLDAAPD